MKTTISITEIRNFLKIKNATIEKQKMLLNGNSAYKVEYADGAYIIDTAHGIKERYVNCAL